VKWRGWQGGPTGTITDDTQLTMEVARSLLATGGRLDPDDLSARLIAWLPGGRGVGHATRTAIRQLEQGVPWWRVGPELDAAGNGASIRAAPIGLVHAFDKNPDGLRRDAVLSALPTHGHRVGVAGAMAIAAGVAWCVREQAQGHVTVPDRHSLLAFVCDAIAGVEVARTPERKPGGTAIRLAERLAELPKILDREPSAAFAYMYNGAFALESVPSAFYCFLRTPLDPEHVILTAVNAGHDADSVASMAGNLAGAWHGAHALQQAHAAWWADLEVREDLLGLGTRLARLAQASVGQESHR
jgi:ADP-ribosylglycohydrolase